MNRLMRLLQQLGRSANSAFVNYSQLRSEGSVGDCFTVLYFGKRSMQFCRRCPIPKHTYCLDSVTSALIISTFEIRFVGFSFGFVALKATFPGYVTIGLNSLPACSKVVLHEQP
ncbi:hypothetical protein L596_030869 [Steinernema carpocapsae]|uniref:Uncharacterized protein n=1 Tax=Steinernema carpocapsae TaxID=34508 RepID=A0A4U5LNG7_STECR|nr:hypothetical protein L596_030869 [Steinernema carpocapsae]